MIAKDFRSRPSTDPLRRAGDNAERQMAHYLGRAFGEHPGIWVFHGLRLERAGEVAQIDHLLLHRTGMVLIESKSVTSRVRINAREEWARFWNGQWTGMASPVLQAERQAELLRALLSDHTERLLARACRDASARCRLIRWWRSAMPASSNTRANCRACARPTRCRTGRAS